MNWHSLLLTWWHSFTNFKKSGCFRPLSFSNCFFTPLIVFITHWTHWRQRVEEEEGKPAEDEAEHYQPWEKCSCTYCSAFQLKRISGFFLRFYKPRIIQALLSFILPNFFLSITHWTDLFSTRDFSSTTFPNNFSAPSFLSKFVL